MLWQHFFFALYKAAALSAAESQKNAVYQATVKGIMRRDGFFGWYICRCHDP